MSYGTRIYDQRNSEDLGKEFCSQDRKRISSSLHTTSRWGSLLVSTCIRLTVGTSGIIFHSRNDDCKAQCWLGWQLADSVMVAAGSLANILLIHTRNSWKGMISAGLPKPQKQWDTH